MSSGRSPRPVRQNRWARRAAHLLAAHREHAEVVEVVLAQLQVRQLGRPHHEQQGPQRHVAGSHQPAQGERPGGVGLGAHHRSGPAVVGLVGLGVLGPGDGLPRVAGPLDDEGELGGERLGIAQQRFHQLSCLVVGGTIDRSAGA